MHTVAVTWGYANADPRGWGAHEVVDLPADLLRFVS